MAYPPHADPDPARWQHELDRLQYVNHQLRTDLDEARMAVAQANKDAAAYREEVIDLKNKIEVFWDSIEGARAMFIRSFPNYNSYRDSHKRSREADERERLSRKSQRLEPPPVASSSALGRDRERETRRGHYPSESGVAGAYPQDHDYRSLPRGQPHLSVPVAGTDKHTYSNGRSPYDTHPPGPYPDSAHPHVDPTRGHSASPHLATRIPSHQGHRHVPSDPNAYPPPDAQTHVRRESGDPMLIPRQRRPPNAEQATTRSSPSPSAPPPHTPGGPIDPNPNRPALPPAGAIIIHPPAAFQVSFTDLQPGIFLDRSDFGAEYPPNLDPPQGLQAVRCLFCDKHYSGANARSLWRRHVMGKHDFTMKGQRASTVRNRHMAQPSITSISGDLLEPAPPSSVPGASPVQPQTPALSRPPESRPPPPQRAPSPGHNRPRRAEGEGEHLESEDDQDAFDYQRHRGAGGRKAPEAPSNGNGVGSPLTHAALESWNKGSGASTGGDVVRWQGQGSVPGKPSAQGPAPGPKVDDEEQTVGSQEATAGQDKQREWCLCRRPDSRGEMIHCNVPTCAIQWYHARCVGMDPGQAKAKQEWICEGCNRKTAQRRQEAHRDGPLAAAPDKDRTSIPRTPEPGTPLNQSQPKTNSRPEGQDQNRRDQDEDVVMRPAESSREARQPAGNNDAASNISEEEPVRGGPRKAHGRRVLSESQSPITGQDAQREGADAPTGTADAQSEPSSARAPPASLPDDSTGQSEPPDQPKSSGTPRKKGWKGYALVPVPDGAEGTPHREPTPQVVTTPGGTRRTRSGKAFFLEDGVSASDGERQHSMETN